MNLINVYLKLKEKECKKLILLESGCFYRTYYDDALILKKIFNYKYCENKVGFPKEQLSNILNKLNDVGIDVLVYNSLMEFKLNKRKTLANNYSKFLKDSKSLIDFENKLDSLNVLIKNKLSENSDNYLKIRDFVNEL